MTDTPPDPIELHRLPEKPLELKEDSARVLAVTREDDKVEVVFHPGGDQPVHLVIFPADEAAALLGKLKAVLEPPKPKKRRRTPTVIDHEGVRVRSKLPKDLFG